MGTSTVAHPCDLYQELRTLYDRINCRFFNNTLPACMILLRVRPRTLGYFQPSCWGRLGETVGTLDAIAMNTATFQQRKEDEILSTLAHEMVHLWQEHYGEHVPTKNYHNREWGQKMMQLGLMPSATGKPGGKKTGTNVSHYILPDGDFERFYTVLTQEWQKPLVSWHEMPKVLPRREQEKKYKHVCGLCGAKAWAHEGTDLLCGNCKEPLVQVMTQLPLLVGVGAEVIDMTTGEVS